MAIALNPRPIYSAVRNALLWCMSMIVLGTLSAFLHELGHYLAARSIGFSAALSFDGGGHVDTVPDLARLPIVVSGPAVTWGLALVCLAVRARLKPARDSISEIALTSAAIWNSLFRLSSLVDGAYSDEAKMAALLGVPGLVLVLPTLLLALVLAHFAMRERFSTLLQPLAIPAFFVASALSFRLGFYLLDSWVG